VVEVITPSLSLALPHFISLIFLNLPSQSEVRISFSLSLINLSHLLFFHLLLSPLCPSLLSSGSPSPAAFLILQFFSPLLSRPPTLLHVIDTPAEVIVAPPSCLSFSFHFHLSLLDLFFGFPALTSKALGTFHPGLLTLSRVLSCSLSAEGSNSEARRMLKPSIRHLKAPGPTKHLWFRSDLI